MSVCVLFKVVQDGPEVEAEEGVCVAAFVIELLYLEVEGGEFKQTTVPPGPKKTKNKKKNKATQRLVSPKTFKETCCVSSAWVGSTQLHMLLLQDSSQFPTSLQLVPPQCRQDF